MNIITARYWGRTGNMLFQIAAAIYYSDKLGRPFLLSKCPEFPNIDNHSPESIGLDATEFSDSLIDFSEEEIVTFFERRRNLMCICDGAGNGGFSGENGSGVRFPENQNIKLTGFYQNWKMVEECKAQLFDVVGIREIRANIVPIIQSPEFQKRGLYGSDHPTIGLHIRRGDYEQLACYFLLLNEYYYKGALLNIANRLVSSSKKINVLCFYEKSSTDSAKKIIDTLFSDKDLSTYPFEYHHFNDLLPTKITDVQELAAISYCDHNIIANSTFSWWAAYIGHKCHSKETEQPDNQKKIICYPDEYFNHQLHYLSNIGLKVDGWTEIKAWNPNERKCACLW
jgi:hypothetical protein